MDKILEYVFNKFTEDDGELCYKVDELFQPFLDRLKELLPNETFLELEDELVRLYIQAEILAGVEGIKLMQGITDGTIKLA